MSDRIQALQGIVAAASSAPDLEAREEYTATARHRFDQLSAELVCTGATIAALEREFVRRRESAKQTDLFAAGAGK